MTEMRKETPSLQESNFDIEEVSVETAELDGNDSE